MTLPPIEREPSPGAILSTVTIPDASNVMQISFAFTNQSGTSSDSDPLGMDEIPLFTSVDSVTLSDGTIEFAVMQTQTDQGYASYKVTDAADNTIPHSVVSFDAGKITLRLSGLTNLSLYTLKLWATNTQGYESIEAFEHDDLVDLIPSKVPGKPTINEVARDQDANTALVTFEENRDAQASKATFLVVKKTYNNGAADTTHTYNITWDSNDNVILGDLVA
jgi:hypothetical protein